MGAYLEFQDLLLGLFEQAGLEAYTVHDYIDTEQLGRRWDLMCRHHGRPVSQEEIITTVSIRLNSPLEVLLEEAAALDWEPGEDVNLDNSADGEVEVEVRLAGDLIGDRVAPFWDTLKTSLAEADVFERVTVVREERLAEGEAAAEGTLHLHLWTYPEPQDFCRDSFWDAVTRALADTLHLLQRQFPEQEGPGGSRGIESPGAAPP